MRKRFLQGSEVGEHDKRGERRKIPRPRTYRIINHLIQHRTGNAMVLALRGKHTLNDIPATTRLRARIPHVPPLDRDRDDKHGNKQVGIVHIRDKRQMLLHDGIGHHRRKAAHIGMPERVHHANDGANHDYHEKEEVRIYRTAKSAKRGVYYGCNGSDDDYSPLVNAEKHLADLDGGEHHQSRSDHVEHYSEIYRTESAQEGGGLPRIAQFVELDVALRAGTHPQLRIDKHRHHAGQQKRPPLPVFAETRIPDEFGEHVRGIRGCRCGAHGYADKPPRH